MKHFLVLLLLIVGVFVAASDAVAVEARCTALGAICKCSNTFNSNGWTYSGGSNPEYYHETAVPPGRCGDVVGGEESIEVYIGNVGPPVSVVETGMPAGNTVNYVYQMNQHTEDGPQLYGYYSGNGRI